MRKKIRIFTDGVPSDYQDSLVPRIIESLGYCIEWSTSQNCDLRIYGPNYRAQREKSWVPKPLRPFLSPINKTRIRPSSISIFQTGENVRQDFVKADFSISFDLAVNSPNHLRLPYWIEVIDWQHEGIAAKKNIRFGAPVKLHRLAQPLGHNFIKKPHQIALFSSHLREPRKTLFETVSKILPTIGFGSYFDKSIEHHNRSGIRKIEMLNSFAFNLCPENSMHPGYYTEKIPEAFMADCLPLTWTDVNVEIDFNPKAMLNLAPMMASNFDGLHEILTSKSKLNDFVDQPLILKVPNLDEHKKFIYEIINQATS